MADLSGKVKKAIHDFLMDDVDLYCVGHLVEQPHGTHCKQLADIIMGLVDDEHPDGDPCTQCEHASMAEHGPGGCISCGCSSPFGGLC
jgi:hypothetical protein